jgi:molybdopterin-guanine dinucleotide biosynthesis protein A
MSFLWNDKEMKRAVRQWKYGRNAKKDVFFADNIYPHLKGLSFWLVSTKRNWVFYIPDDIDVVRQELVASLVESLKEYRENKGTTLMHWLIICGHNHLIKQVQHYKMKKRDHLKEVLVDDLVYENDVDFDDGRGELTDHILKYWNDKNINKHFRGLQRTVAKHVIDIISNRNKTHFGRYHDITGYVVKQSKTNRATFHLAMLKFRRVNKKLRNEFELVK